MPPLAIEVETPATTVSVSTGDGVLVRLDLPLLPEIVIRR
jgi:hypothetical protein